MTKVAQQQLDFKHLFQALPGLYLILSPDFSILAVSDPYLQATHTTREGIQGRNLFDVFLENPDSLAFKSRNTVESSLRHVVEHKEPHKVPLLRYDVLNKEGHFESRFWQLSSFPAFDEQGRISYIIHDVRDVTAQAVAEQEMKVSENSLRLMANAVGGVSWECDIKNNTFFWDEALKSLFGYSDSDLVMQPQQWVKLTHPDDYDMVRSSFADTIEKRNKVFVLEYRFVKADGSIADVMSYGYVLYNQEGEALRIVGSLMDLSNQKEREQKIKESNERFERIAMATNDVIWDWNLRNDLIWWNEGFKTLFGYKEEEIEPTIISWKKRIHPDDLVRVEESIHHAIDNLENVWESEYRFKCADGSFKLIRDKGYILHDTAGQPVRMVGAMQDITEMRRHEQQLFDNLAWAKVIMESLPLMTWTAEPDGEINYFNQRWTEYTGAPFEQLKAWQNYIHPDDLEKTQAAWRKTIQSGEMLTLENRWRSVKDGSYRWFLVRVVPIRDSDGQVTMWIGTHTDIEEHKQVQLALEESHHKFRFLTESIPQMVWSANPDGYMDYTNQRWYDYTKMNEESLGFGWLPAIHPDEGQKLMDTWMHCVATGENLEFDVRFKDTEAGTFRWFLLRAEPMRNSAGEIIKWFGTATDVHEQKLLQEGLQASEERFRFLADSIPQMIWTTGPDGNHEYFNRRWLDYTGLSQEESRGTVWLDMVHPEDRERAWDRWQYSIQTGTFYEIEYRFKNGFNGTYRWFLGLAMPMRDAEGNITNWFGTCTDIEDHKRAEEELLEKNAELERMNQDLDSFVYTASHDLKLPIINMAGIFEELTRNAVFHDPDAPQMITMFNKSLEQLHNTIHDLAEVVKVQKTKDRNLESLDLEELTEDVLIGLQDNLKDANVQVVTDFSEAPAVAFTRASLKSVLYNLISNAIKYRSPDRDPVIRISSTPKGEFIELVVQDNGLGIDMNKHQNKLFQMFKRFHSHVKGSGLGLYIVNRLLTNHGGHINIESSVGHGTTFYLYFKQKKAATADAL